MESYKIKVLGGDEINDLISDLLELALEMKDVDDIRVLIRLAQIFMKRGNRMRRGLRESEKKVLTALALAPVRHKLQRQANVDLWLDGMLSTEDLAQRMSDRIERCTI